MQRRSFLASILAAAAAPAIVRAGVLMPIKAPEIWTPGSLMPMEIGQINGLRIYANCENLSLDRIARIKAEIMKHAVSAPNLVFAHEDMAAVLIGAGYETGRAVEAARRNSEKTLKFRRFIPYGK